MKVERAYKFKSLLFTESDIYQVESEWHEKWFSNIELAFLLYKMLELRVNSIEKDIKVFEESLDRQLRKFNRPVLVTGEVETGLEIECVKHTVNKIETLKTLLRTYKKLKRLLQWLEK